MQIVRYNVVQLICLILPHPTTVQAVACGVLHAAAEAYTVATTFLMFFLSMHAKLAKCGFWSSCSPQALLRPVQLGRYTHLASVVCFTHLFCVPVSSVLCGFWKRP